MIAFPIFKIFSIIVITAFGYKNKEENPIYISKKCCKEKHANLLLIGKEEKIHYVIIKEFNTQMYNRSFHRGRKPFCRCCLQTFSTEEILKRNIKDSFKINNKQMIIMPKNVNMLN